MSTTPGEDRQTGPHDPSPHGQGPAPSPYGQYGQPPYGTQPYAQPQYGTPSYEQQYAAAPYGPYGQPGGYAAPAARPGGVMAAAVLGFVWGALGAIVTVTFLLGGALFSGSSAEADDALPGLGGAFGAAAGILVFLGLLALAWTVVTIWGSVWALTGRSRVMLIVAGSIAIGCTGLLFLAGLGSVQDEGGGGVVIGLIGLIVSILIVVLLSNRQAAAWFAAERARRPR